MKLRIFEKSEAIKNYLADLKDLNIDKIEKLDIKEKYYASSMILFSILNDFFILGDEFIDNFDLEIAQTYKEIFVILEKDDFISKDELIFCSRIVFLRNKFAHEYGIIKKEELFELIEKTDFIRKIIDKLIKKVQEEEEEGNYN